MQIVALRKGEGIANETGKTLTEDIELSFDMIGVSFHFVHHLMGLIVKDVTIGLPTITVGRTPYAITR